VVHDGTPGGLVLNQLVAGPAVQRGLRVVQLARPGYGRSTARPGRTVADVVPDVAAVLDAAGAGPYVSVGFSGGGPHSLACAALAPGRCLGAASVAGVAPYQAEGLDFLAGMGPENVAEFRCAVQGAQVLTGHLEREAGPLRAVTGEQVTAALAGILSAADVAALTGEVAGFLAQSVASGVRDGVAGWRDDDLAFVADWGFPLAELGGRAAIWQGEQDKSVPLAHGQWLAARIPGARVHLEPGEGHISLPARCIERILEDLLELAGRH
jgi:pimeloyl-ACP methyl ester carboxylesterase